jgi:hypothetical protein
MTTSRCSFQSAAGPFLYRDDGDLALIEEVRNTFGDIHAYVLPVRRPPARRDLPWPPARFDYGGAAAVVL